MSITINRVIIVIIISNNICYCYQLTWWSSVVQNRNISDYSLIQNPPHAKLVSETIDI